MEAQGPTEGIQCSTAGVNSNNAKRLATSAGRPFECTRCGRNFNYMKIMEKHMLACKGNLCAPLKAQPQKHKPKNASQMIGEFNSESVVHEPMTTNHPQLPTALEPFLDVHRIGRKVRFLAVKSFFEDTVPEQDQFAASVSASRGKNSVDIAEVQGKYSRCHRAFSDSKLLVQHDLDCKGNSVVQRRARSQKLKPNAHSREEMSPEIKTVIDAATSVPEAIGSADSSAGPIKEEDMVSEDKRIMETSDDVENGRKSLIVFPTISPLTQHLQSPPKHYKCNLCDAAFAEVRLLERHRNLHLEIKRQNSTQCHLCFKTYKTRCILKTHLVSHTSRFKCEQCGKNHQSVGHLEDHVRRHLRIKSHQCHVCKSRHASIGDLKKHMTKHLKSHRCDKCQLEFLRKCDLAEHSYTHKPHQCHLCTASFFSELNLTKHKKSFHTAAYKSGNSNDIVIGTKASIKSNDKGTDACKDADTPDKNEKAHESTSNHSYACSVCSKVFANRNARNSHLNKHKNRFKCDHCDKSFHSAAHLKFHTNAHSRVMETPNERDNSTEPPVIDLDGGESLNSTETAPESFEVAVKSEEFEMEWKEYEITPTTSTLRTIPLKFNKLDGDEDINLDGGEFLNISDSATDSAPDSYEVSVEKSEEIEKEWRQHETTPTTLTTRPLKSDKTVELENPIAGAADFHFQTLGDQIQTGENEVDQTKYACDACGDTFAELCLLEDHRNQHLETKKHHAYKCPICSKSYALKTSFKSHLIKHTSRYQCTICKASSGSAADLKKHLRVHSKRYKCDHCERAFQKQSALKDHINAHLGIKQHKCAFCAQRLTTYNSLIKHQNTYHNSEVRASREFDLLGDDAVKSTEESPLRCPPDRRSVCPICSNIYASQRSLKIHLVKHTSRHKCEHCDKGFQSSTHLQAHISTHFSKDQTPNERDNSTEPPVIDLDGGESLNSTETAPESFEVAVKSEEFEMEWKEYEITPTTSTLRTIPLKFNKLDGDEDINLDGGEFLNISDSDTDSAPESYEVSVEKSEEIEKEWRQHETTPTTLTTKPLKSDKTVELETPIAGAADFHFQTLGDQTQTGENEVDQTKYACDACGDTFAELCLLEDHRNQHLETQKHHAYKCPICSKSYALKTSFKSHLIKHTSRHQCTICKASSGSAADLKKHLRVHSKRYKCDHCERAFQKQSALKDHINAHLGIKQHKCAFCAQRLTTYNSLIKHQNIYHNSEVRASREFDLLGDDAAKSTEESPPRCPPDRRSVCPICSNIYASQRSLKIHLVKHTSRHKCEHCDKGFQSSTHLQAHISTHFSKDQKIASSYAKKKELKELEETKGQQEVPIHSKTKRMREEIDSFDDVPLSKLIKERRNSPSTDEMELSDYLEFLSEDEAPTCTF